MSGRGKARTEKAVKKRVNKKAGKSVSEEVAWQASLNSQRNGASYFTALANVLHATPRGYFEHRLITTESKNPSFRSGKDGWDSSYKANSKFFEMLVPKSTTSTMMLGPFLQAAL